MSKAKRRRKLGYEATEQLPPDTQFRMGNSWTIRSTEQLRTMLVLGAATAEEFIPIPVPELPDSLQATASPLADEDNYVWVLVRPS